MTQIKIIKQIERTVRDVFYFIVQDPYIVFFMYEHQVRNAPRREFVTVKVWSPHRSNSITLDDVPITDEIKQEAITEYIKKLRVRTLDVDAWKTGPVNYISFSDEDLLKMKPQSDNTL